jgi:hypothetical protein
VAADRCSSAELFIRKNPVGVVDAGVDAGGDDGDGASRLIGRRRFHGTDVKCCCAQLSRYLLAGMKLNLGFFALGS